MKSLFTIILVFVLLLIFELSQAQDFDIYVSSGGSNAVIKYDQDGQNPSVFIPPSSGGLNWPQDIIFLNEEEIIVSGLNSRQVKKYNAKTGEYLGNFISVNTNAGPTRMKIGKDNLLYVLLWGIGGSSSHKVQRYELDGSFVDEFTSSGIAQAIGMDWDAEGNFYIASYGGRYIRKYDAEGEFVTTWITSVNLQGPTNIWFDDNGDLLVVDYNAGSIKRFDSEGQFKGVFISGLNLPEGIAFLPNGNILVGNGGTNQVKVFDKEGNFISNFASSEGNLVTPNAVVIKQTVSTSTDDIETAKFDFVYPTIGTAFQLADSASKKIKSIEIYDISGQIITRKNITSETTIWNASNVLEGVYIILGHTSEGKIYKQKVLVSH